MTESGENSNPPEGDTAVADSPPGIEAVLLERRNRRRMDLLTFDGILREHARIYRQFKDGRVGFKKFDAASRALRRQGELLRDRDAKALQDREDASQSAVVATLTSTPAPTLGDFYASLSAFRGALPAVTNDETPST